MKMAFLKPFQSQVKKSVQDTAGATKELTEGIQGKSAPPRPLRQMMRHECGGSVRRDRGGCEGT